MSDRNALLEQLNSLSASTPQDNNVRPNSVSMNNPVSQPSNDTGRSLIDALSSRQNALNNETETTIGQLENLFEGDEVGQETMPNNRPSPRRPVQLNQEQPSAPNQRQPSAPNQGQFSSNRPVRGGQSMPVMERPQEEDDYDLGDFSDGPVNLGQEQPSGRRPIMEDDDDEYVPRRRRTRSSDSDGNGGLFSKIKIPPKYIAIGVGILVFILLGSFLEGKGGSTGTTLGDSEIVYQDGQVVEVPVEETVEEASSGEVEDTGESQEYVTEETTGVSGATVERGVIINDTELAFSKDWYDDSISINKFIEFRGGSCIPKIMGYSSVLGKEIEFNVSASEYNKYLNGAKINIQYRAVENEGVTYVTDIKIVN